MALIWNEVPAPAELYVYTLTYHQPLDGLVTVQVSSGVDEIDRHVYAHVSGSALYRT